MSSLYSIGAMNQLADALEAAGYTPEDVTKLKQFNNLASIRNVLNGYAEVKTIEHLIDCDANPFIPDGWEVVEHKKGGQFKWDPARVSLYLSKSQKDGKVTGGNKLRKELEKMPVLNANVLDYLLANPHLIPEEWKGKYVFFWGTIFRYSDGDLSVRYLYWRGVRWGWHCYWLDGDWLSDDPAALLAS